MGTLLWMVLLLRCQTPPLDVNTATAGQLASVNGISPSLAQALVEDREQHGPFESLQALTRVPGVTSAWVSQVGALLSVEPPPLPRGAVDSEAEVRTILARFAAEPRVADAQRAAVNHARVNPELVDGWRTRARWAGAAPQVRLGGGYVPQRDFQWLQTEGARDAMPPPTGTPGITRHDSFNNRAEVSAQVQWNLDRLVFDPQEPRVNREAMRLSLHMDKVLEEVTRKYFERRRLQVDLVLAPPLDVPERLRKEVRLQELTADLDALTGGYFCVEQRKRGLVC